MLYVVRAYPTNISSHFFFSCAYSPEVIHILHNSYRLRSFQFLFRGNLARIIISWSFMRPRKKRLKIPISFAYWVKAYLTISQLFTAIWIVTCTIYRAKNIDLLGQSLTKLALIYAIAIWRFFASYVRSAKKRF